MCGMRTLSPLMNPNLLFFPKDNVERSVTMYAATLNQVYFLEIVIHN